MRAGGKEAGLAAVISQPGLFWSLLPKAFFNLGQISHTASVLADSQLSSAGSSDHSWGRNTRL